MDKQIRKIETLVKRYLHQPKADIKREYGLPSENSDDEIWLYREYKYCIFRNETVFIFKNNRVTDIIIFEYILWMPRRDLFYHENHTPEYEVVKYY